MLKHASLIALPLYAGTALAQNDAPPRARPGPPQEALDACKAAGILARYGRRCNWRCWKPRGVNR